MLARLFKAACRVIRTCITGQRRGTFRAKGKDQVIVGDIILDLLDLHFDRMEQPATLAQVVTSRPGLRGMRPRDIQLQEVQKIENDITAMTWSLPLARTVPRRCPVMQVRIPCRQL